MTACHALDSMITNKPGAGGDGVQPGRTACSRGGRRAAGGDGVQPGETACRSTSCSAHMDEASPCEHEEILKSSVSLE